MGRHNRESGRQAARLILAKFGASLELDVAGFYRPKCFPRPFELSSLTRSDGGSVRRNRSRPNVLGSPEQLLLNFDVPCSPDPDKPLARELPTAYED